MSQSTFDVTVHTDGACSGNPGPGGWAAVLSAGENKKEIAGSKAHTTNNEMETRSCSPTSRPDPRLLGGRLLAGTRNL